MANKIPRVPVREQDAKVRATNRSEERRVGKEC